ncbi:Glycosyl transferase family 2 [Salinimicrobium sediminis]|uniref:Glycosyl transferase family 2 n=1 Tax=Salinimicrobium sediminis TaxID=1343891 RepID=A0A285X5M7_9FLAO|nr:glycosyltransferase [Salinimicrobium sediminis]SOC80316.1 Glycosyl transferase family 2 [Salinimicrobium sediminis]
MNFTEFRARYERREIIPYPNNVKEKPLLSVLVQTYNHENFIQKCLEGILEQRTDFDFEILLGEDNSTDKTRDICIEYAEKYPKKIRLFLHHPENKIKVLNIITGNFNALYNFYSARGEYIAFCEGDDVWKDPLKLQKQVDVLKQNTHLAFTYHSFIEVNHKEELLPKEFVLEQPAQNISREDLKKLNFHPLLSTMCFRNFGNELPEQMAEVINVDSFLLSLLGNFGEAEFIENIAPSYYKRHEGGMWSGRNKELKLKSKNLTFEALQKYYHYKGEEELNKEFRKEIKNTHRILFLYYLKKFQFLNSFYLMRSLF